MKRANRNEHEEIAADLRAQIAQEITEASGGVALPAGPLPLAERRRASSGRWGGTDGGGLGYRFKLRVREGIDVEVPEGHRSAPPPTAP